MPQTGQQGKQQCLYLVTARVQIVTRKQPATIIHPQPPSGGPVCRARRDEAMAMPPCSSPQWQRLAPALMPSTGWGCSAHGSPAIWGEKTGRAGVRTHCTGCNLNGWAGRPASALRHKGECFLSHAVYENLLETRGPSK